MILGYTVEFRADNAPCNVTRSFFGGSARIDAWRFVHHCDSQPDILAGYPQPIIESR